MKEAIVNSSDQYVATINGDFLNIAGFGTFDATKLISAVGARARDAQLAKLVLTVPSAATLGITAGTGWAVILHLRVNSSRMESENAIDFLKRGRPFILEIAVDSTDTAATIATKIDTALTNYKAKFNIGTLPFTWSVNSADITFTGTEGKYNFSDTVTFFVRKNDFAYTAVTTGKIATALTVTSASGNALVLSATTGLNVGDTIAFDTDSYVKEYVITSITSATALTVSPTMTTATAADYVAKVYKGAEAIQDGKYLEENVRMSTPFTSDSYAIRPYQLPIIGAKYTMISWEMSSLDVNTAAKPGMQDHKSTSALSTGMAKQIYTIYFNEATAMTQATALATWLEAATAVAWSDFKIANGGSATNGTVFTNNTF